MALCVPYEFCPTLFSYFLPISFDSLLLERKVVSAGSIFSDPQNGRVASSLGRTRQAGQ